MEIHGTPRTKESPCKDGVKEKNSKVLSNRTTIIQLIQVLHWPDINRLISLNPHPSPVGWASLLSHFYRWGTLGSKLLHDEPEPTRYQCQDLYSMWLQSTCLMNQQVSWETRGCRLRSSPQMPTPRLLSVSQPLLLLTSQSPGSKQPKEVTFPKQPHRCKEVLSLSQSTPGAQVPGNMD